MFTESSYKIQNKVTSLEIHLFPCIRTDGLRKHALIAYSEGTDPVEILFFFFLPSFFFLRGSVQFHPFQLYGICNIAVALCAIRILQIFVFKGGGIFKRSTISFVPIF